MIFFKQVSLICIAAAISLTQIARAELQFTNWTARCLTSYDEKFYVGSVAALQIPKTILPHKDFVAILDKFLTKFDAQKKETGWTGTPGNTGTQYEGTYIQQLTVKDKDEVCFIGDLHGSLHSELRNLWRLIALDKIDKKTLKLADNFYLVHLGDYVDRGRYGVEVLYTLLRLKCAEGADAKGAWSNWAKVILSRGNHETQSQNEKYGFLKELNEKYNANAGTIQYIQKESKTAQNGTKEPKDDRYEYTANSGGLYDKILKLYKALPLATYITCGANTVMAAHGGFSSFEKLKYYEKPTSKYVYIPLDTKKIPILSSKDNTQLKDENNDLLFSKKDSEDPAFNWQDIGQEDCRQDTKLSDRKKVSIGAEEFENRLKNLVLKGLFKAHQHFSYGMKMIFSKKNAGNLKVKLIESQDEVPLYHWTDVALQIAGTVTTPEKFKIHDHLPVFIFSSAPEGVGETYDCFGILTVATAFTDWTLKPYEFPSPLTDMKKDKKFSSFHLSEYKKKRDIAKEGSVIQKQTIDDPICVIFTAKP